MSARARRPDPERDAAAVAAHLSLCTVFGGACVSRSNGQHDIDVRVVVHGRVRDDRQLWSGVAFQADQSEFGGEQGPPDAGAFLDGASRVLSEHVRPVRDDRSGDWAHYVGVVLEQFVVHLCAAVV